MLNSYDISLYDLGQNGLGLTLVTIYVTPGNPRALTIYNGLAYVADGQSGLQVLNYIAYDQGTNPPSISLQTSFNADLPTAEENQYFRVSALVTDDVQVRNVEFYLDGQRMLTDGNYPFETRLLAPGITPTKSTFTLRARAADTGGNTTWTLLLTVTLVPDATPPRLVNSFPKSGTVAGAVESLVAYFSEPIDASTFSGDGFSVRGAGADGLLGNSDDEVVHGTISYREELRAAFLTLPTPLAPGAWEARVGRQIADLAGNHPANDFTWRFWVLGGVDSDQDGIPDAAEAAFGYDPANPDSNGNGLIDGDEDADGDGIPNAWELAFGLDPLNPDSNGNGILDGDEDPDHDGLTTRQEFRLGTSPILADSDGDGWNDESEVTAGTNPLDSKSRPFMQVVAQPPVRIVLPDLRDPNYAVNTTVALPPVRVVLPTLGDPVLPANTTVARPPARIVLPTLGDLVLPANTTVARPPVRVTISPQ